MSEENKKIVNERPQGTLVSEKESSMQILLQKVLGDGSFSPNEKQVDEILSQRREISGYIHKDRKRDSSDNKFYFFCALLACIAIIVLVLFFAKEFLTQVLSLIIGAFGGYGFGKSQNGK
ncbi:MAG: hypothetical protein Q8Q95_02155 [bacterium]|nr:hypothetical protein [bacterium]